LAAVARAHGADPARLSVIGNGIDPALFHAPAPGEAAAARRALGLPEGKTILLSVGHLAELKGFHLAIEAVAALRREDVCYVVVGEGAERARLEALTARLGVTDKVRLPGAVGQGDLPRWYAAADFFVLMSSREGWPNVVCEAQAMSLPVLATRVGGVEEIVSAPGQGILLEERSADALAGALAEALQRPWDRAAIARAGSMRTWEAVAEKLEPLFREAAASV
jgi:glycosyltransferase involved in cell wall biosynthesis